MNYPNTLKHIVAGIIAVATTCGEVMAEERSSGKAAAMTCSITYSIMSQASLIGEHHRKVFYDHAVLMETLYFSFDDTYRRLGREAAAERSDQAHTIAAIALYERTRMSAGALEEQLIFCEGWREELMAEMYFRTSDPDYSQSQLFANLPGPRATYPEPENVSLTEVSLMVDDALYEWHQKIEAD